MRKRHGLALLAVVLVLGVGLFLWSPWNDPRQPISCPPDRAEPGRLEKQVRKLVESSPRDLGHPESLERIGKDLAQALAAAGARVETQPFSAEGAAYRNVQAHFGPSEGARVVVGAHYDAAGEHPGADDNASGVAALLELGLMLGRTPPAGPVELVAFALEEPPIFRTPRMGSFVHASKLAQDKVEVRAMISLETMGFFSDAPDSQRYPHPALKLAYPSRGNFLGVIGRMGEEKLTRLVAASMRAASPLPIEALNAPRSMRGVDFSDHQSYWKQGFPAVMITDTAFFRNPNYHEATDTPETLDYRRLAQAVEGTHCAIRALSSTR